MELLSPRRPACQALRVATSKATPAPGSALRDQLGQEVSEQRTLELTIPHQATREGEQGGLVGDEEAADSPPAFHERRAGGQVCLMLVEIAAVRVTGNQGTADDPIPGVEAIVNPCASQTGGRPQIRGSSNAPSSTAQDQVLGFQTGEGHADLIEELTVGSRQPCGAVFVVLLAFEDGVTSVRPGMADDRNG